MEKSFAESAEKLLRNDIIEVLQDENNRLLAANSRLVRYYRALHELVDDLGRRCLSCRKMPWEPHKPGCEWAPMKLDELDEKFAAEVEEMEAADEDG